MIRLNATNAPRTVGLGFGVEVTITPLTSAIFAAARTDPSVPLLANPESPELGGEVREVVTVALIKAIAVRLITAWDGVGDADGNPVDPSPEWVGMLLDQWSIYEAFNAKIVAPFLLMRQEGNAFASLPNGTSARALDTATDAAKPAPTARES
jgi:hypothetical protein